MPETLQPLSSANMSFPDNKTDGNDDEMMSLCSDTYDYEEDYLQYAEDDTAVSNLRPSMCNQTPVFLPPPVSINSESDTEQEPFHRIYNCHPLTDVGKFHLENGNQIIMPPSALDSLLDSHTASYPMLFEIKNDRGQVSHCGVNEFTGQEGAVVLPCSMMENLKLEVGDRVSIRSTTLAQGTYMMLQPHSMEFLDIPDLKAALEQSLTNNFFCVTKGDTIVISNNGKKYYIDIVETKPASAISIVNTDCEVDFAPPLDYKEPELMKPVKEAEAAAKAPNFLPFTGFARRLDGEPVKEAKAASAAVAKAPNFLPFTGFARRLDGEPVKEAEVASAAVAKAPNFLPFKGFARRLDGEPAAESEHPKADNQNKKIIRTEKKQQFQPFTGRKHLLLD